MSKLHIFTFVISLYWALVSADYTIDDSNYSVLKFSENPSGPVWGPFGSDTGEVLEIRLPNGTMQTVDATQCYDGTYTYAACSASNNCEVQFSFTGSGITIYVLQAGPQGMSASLSIDSGTATTATLGAPPPPQYYIPHVTLFNVQNIQSGTHSAVMTVLDWNGGFSGMMLDYIDVNQAEVSAPTSSNPNPSPSPSPSPSSNPTTSSTPAQSASSTPTSTSGQTASQQTSSTGTQTSPVTSAAIASVLSSQSSGMTALPSSTPGNGSTVSSSSASKKTNLAAIVGGVVGGVVGLLALLGLAFFCFRRRRRQHLQTLNERPGPSLLPQPEARFANAATLSADPFGSSAALSVVQPSGTSRPLRSWSDSEAGSTTNFAARDASNPSPITNFSHSRVASSADDSVTSSVPLSIGLAAAAMPQDHDGSASILPAQPAVRPAPTAAPVIYPNEKSGPAPGSALQQGQTATLDVAGPPPNAVLTDGQADFVNSLFNNNVPAPVVARVLERMLANPQGAGSTGYNDPELRPHLNSGSGPTSWQTMNEIGDGETTIGTAPPSYDYVRAQ